VSTRLSAGVLAILSVVLFCIGVGVQAYGGSESLRVAEVLGVLLWSAPLVLWTAVGGRGTKPRPRKDLMSIAWSGGVFGALLLVSGIALLFTAEGVLAGACLVGTSGLPLGLAVGAYTSPSKPGASPRQGRT